MLENTCIVAFGPLGIRFGNSAQNHPLPGGDRNRDEALCAAFEVRAGKGSFLGIPPYIPSQGIGNGDCAVFQRLDGEGCSNGVVFCKSHSRFVVFTGLQGRLLGTFVNVSA